MAETALYDDPVTTSRGPRSSGPFAQRGETRPEFSRLAVIHALSGAGDALITLALAGSLFFNISPSAAREKVAFSLVLTMAPFAVVAPFLGPAMDRHPQGRRMMLILASGGRAAVALTMVVVLNNLLLFPIAFVSLVLSKAHAIAKASLVPLTVRSERRLVEANAKLAITTVLAGFVSAGIGIVVLQVTDDTRWVLRMAFVVFLLAMLSALRVPVDGEKPQEDVTPKTSSSEELDTNISVAATTMAAIRGVVGFTAFLLAFSFRRQDAPTWHFGLVVAMSMGSSFLGAFVAPSLRERIKEERLLTAALLISFAGATLASQLDGLDAGLVLCFCVGLSASIGKMSFDSLVQRDAPGDFGASFARFEAGFQLVWVLGALLPVVLPIPQQAGELMVAAAMLSVTALYLFGRHHLGKVRFRLPRLRLRGRRGE